MQPITKIKILGARLGVVVLAAYWSAIFLGTHLPGRLSPAPRFNDKTKHFLAFFVLALLLCYVTNSQRALRRFGGIAVICLIYAAIDEWTQGWVVGRVPDVRDFIADAAGAGLAIVLFATLRFFFGKR